MNGIILKDLYNIKNYTKNVIIILLILSTLLLQSNAMIIYRYILYSGFVFSKLISTTFALDEMSKWDRYCLITPL